MDLLNPNSLTDKQEAMSPSYCVARVHAGPRGSARVLEEARESIFLESGSLAFCTMQLFVWRGSTRVLCREAVLFAARPLQIIEVGGPWAPFRPSALEHI